MPVATTETDSDRYYRSPKRIDPTTTYVFPRTLGGGVILGGSRQDDDWSNDWDPALEKQILERSCKLAPELGRPEDLQVIARNIGLRRKYCCADRVSVILLIEEQLQGKAVHALRSRRRSRNGMFRLCTRMDIREQGTRPVGVLRREYWSWCRKR